LFLFPITIHMGKENSEHYYILRASEKCRILHYVHVQILTGGKKLSLADIWKKYSPLFKRTSCPTFRIWDRFRIRSIQNYPEAYPTLERDQTRTIGEIFYQIDSARYFDTVDIRFNTHRETAVFFREKDQRSRDLCGYCAGTGVPWIPGMKSIYLAVVPSWASIPRKTNE